MKYSLWMSCSHTCLAMARTVAWDCTSPLGTNTEPLQSHTILTDRFSVLAITGTPKRPDQCSGWLIGGVLWAFNKSTPPLFHSLEPLFKIILAINLASLTQIKMLLHIMFWLTLTGLHRQHTLHKGPILCTLSHLYFSSLTPVERPCMINNPKQINKQNKIL